MMKAWYTWLVLVGLLIVLAACRATGPALPSPTMMPTAAPMAASMPLPTPDPLAALPPGTLPPETRVVLSTPVDCDGDGALEGLVLYRDGNQAYSEGYGLVVESDSTIHHLGGDVPSVLFAEEAPRPAEVDVYDHNGDGWPEILITGLLGPRAAVVSVFGRDGSGYPALLSLVGEDGVLVEEAGTITARTRAEGYVTEETATWEDSAYRVQTSYRRTETLKACLAATSPACAVVVFYDLLGQGEAATALTLLDRDLQAQVSPEELVPRFGRVLVGLEAEAPGDGAGTVHVQVTSEGALDGVEQETRYEITWQLVKREGVWKLDRAKVQTR